MKMSWPVRNVGHTGLVTGVDRMAVRVAHVRHDSKPLDSQRLLGSHGQRAQLLIVGDGMGDILLDHELMLAVDGTRHVVAHVHLGARGHRAALGIGQAERGLTTRRALLHKAAISLLTLLEALDLFLQLRSGRLMDTGCLTIGCIQIAPVLRHRLIDGREGLLKLGLRKVLVCAVGGCELTASNGQECCPKEIQLLAQQDKRTEESLKSVGVMFSEISHGLEVGSKLSQKPAALHLAMGFPLTSATGSNPVEGAIDVAPEHIPWIIGWSTCACGLSPRTSKTLEIETLHIRIHETTRILFGDIVIKHLGQKKLLGSAVSLTVSHSAFLRCMGGRLSCSVRAHQEFSHSLALCYAASTTTSSGGCGWNVLVQTKEIRRIILRLDPNEAVVVRAERRAHQRGSVAFLLAKIIQVNGTAR
jgi:hypothetical protein